MARILLIDDDRALSLILGDYLVAQSHEVVIAQSGAEGWEHLQQDKIDFVIMDWEMPEITGIDLIRMYRSAGGEKPVLMLTGKQSLDDKQEGLDAGADDYLIKPFHVQELAARVRAGLRRHSAPKAKPAALGSGNEAVLKRAKLEGTTLAAKYEFIRVIGAGGVGVVYQARHPQLDKFVAIKMLQHAQKQLEALQNFEKEAKAISKLDHPNIAVVHDFGITENQQLFMVMEHFEGKNLEIRIEKDKDLSLAVSLDILIQLCDGLSHAHRAGILHRDLKPSNVMLKAQPHDKDRPLIAKIVDFGNAKFLSNNSPLGAELTSSGQVFGSPPYMSPEQVRGETTDERSDIYGLGSLGYELFTGKPPFWGKTPEEIMLKHVHEMPPPLLSAKPEIAFPEQLQQAIDKALAKFPKQRYQSADEFKTDLERVRARLNDRQPKGIRERVSSLLKQFKR